MGDELLCGSNLGVHACRGEERALDPGLHEVQREGDDPAASAREAASERNGDGARDGRVGGDGPAAVLVNEEVGAEKDDLVSSCGIEPNVFFHVSETKTALRNTKLKNNNRSCLFRT